MAKIIVEFDEQGNQTVKVEDVNGPECEKFQKIFGLGPRTAEHRTEDYYKPEDGSVATKHKQTLSL